MKTSTRLFALAVFCAALLSGCSISPRETVAAQAPGHASGAGATLTGPANSAAPSSQKARRAVAYFPPAVAVSGARNLDAPTNAAPLAGTSLPIGEAPAASKSARSVEIPPEAIPPPPPAPRAAVAWVLEETETKLGEHQDLSAILRVAASVSNWSWLRWVGVASILAGVAGFLWSIGNPAGYPLVFAGVIGSGVVFIFAAAHPAWLLVLLAPLGFYGAQKLGLLRPAS